MPKLKYFDFWCQVEKGLTGTHIWLLQKSIVFNMRDRGELPGNSLYGFVQWLESILSPDDEEDLLLMEMKGGGGAFHWRWESCNYQL